MKEYQNMTKSFIVQEEARLDKFLTAYIEASRNQIEQLIKKSFVEVNGKIISKTGYKLKVEDEVTVNFPQIEASKEVTVDFDVEVIFEDEHIMVLNKPYNLTVHDAPSVKEATLVDWLKSKNISLSTISGEERHGIVHRLDKGTSGVMVIAKSNEAHAGLAAQLEDKSMGRYYLALIDYPLKENTVVNKPISRNPNNRLKMAVVDGGRNAKSAFAKLALSKDEKKELIACKLFTGRTHQIRVHLNALGRHILGDNLYGFKGELNKINRFYLHAYQLYLTHPITKKEMSFTAPLADDMSDYLTKHFNRENVNEQLHEDSFNSLFSTTDHWV